MKGLWSICKPDRIRTDSNFSYRFLYNLRHYAQHIDFLYQSRATRRVALLFFQPCSFISPFFYQMDTPSASVPSGSNEWVPALLLPHPGLRPMPRKDTRLVWQRKHLLLNALQQLIQVAARQIRPADATFEDQITAKENIFLRTIEHAMARRVSW